MLLHLVTGVLLSKLALLSAPFLVALAAILMFGAGLKRPAAIAGLVALGWFGIGAAHQTYVGKIHAAYAAGDAAGATRIQKQFDAFRDQLAEVTAEETRRQAAINAQHAAETKAAADALERAKADRDKEISAYADLLAHDQDAERAARAFNARDVGELQRIFGQARH
jgi:hypothetical protein